MLLDVTLETTHWSIGGLHMAATRESLASLETEVRGVLPEELGHWARPLVLLIVPSALRLALEDQIALLV